MLVTKFILLMLGMLGAGVSASAQADMYKWVDERGVVTYTNVPPPHAKARGKLELVYPGSVTVSTYSSAESKGKAGLTSYERGLQERVALLERELEIERRDRALARETAGEMLANKAAQDAQKLKEKRERCLADRRIDCDRLELDEGSGPMVVARQPQVIRQVIVQPVVVRTTLLPQVPAHHPHVHRSPEANPPSSPHVTLTLGTLPRTGIFRGGLNRRF